MTIWKLVNVYGEGEYLASDGNELSIGRSSRNMIKVCSAVVSRNHCSIKFLQDKALVTDLKSSNGVFISGKKIDPSVPTVAKDSDIIGIGWCSNIPVMIENADKCEFKVTLAALDKIDIESDNGNYEMKISTHNSNENANLFTPNRAETPVHDMENNRGPIICDVRSLCKNEVCDTSESSVENEIPNDDTSDTDSDSDDIMLSGNVKKNATTAQKQAEKNESCSKSSQQLNKSLEKPPKKKSSGKTTRGSAKSGSSNSEKIKKGKITKKNQSQRQGGKK